MIHHLHEGLFRVFDDDGDGNAGKDAIISLLNEMASAGLLHKEGEKHTNKQHGFGIQTNADAC
jgi:hypothetical protein